MTVSIDLDPLLQAHALINADLDRRQDAVAKAEERARSILASCEMERENIASARAHLQAVEMMYRQRFAPNDEGEVAASASLTVGLVGRPKPRARVGEQRYRMLHCLRIRPGEWVSQSEIALATGLNLQRIRRQMKVDAEDGIVSEQGDQYRITPLGLDLLGRFETYKRSRGEPLPALHGPVSEEDEDDDPPPPAFDIDAIEDLEPTEEFGP